MSSTNKFETTLKNTLNNEVAFTENGAASYKTSGHKLLDLNFATSTLRNKSESEVAKIFSEAYYENPLLAVKWMFFCRDIRSNGMGERRTFRICLKWLASIRPDLVKNLLRLISVYGRWDDLFCLITMKNDDPVEDEVLAIIDEQWSSDVLLMKEGKSISLLAKWCPSINTSSPASVKLAKFFCKELSLSEKQYRKTLSAMRKYLNIVEQKMSAKEWNAINYEQVPSKANLKYNTAFLRNDETRRCEFLSKLKNNETKINSSVNFPSDIVHEYIKDKNLNMIYYGHSFGLKTNYKIDPALEAMWKSLPDYIKDQTTGSTIVVADSSGSMTTTVGTGNMTAMEVAYSLAIYFAEKLNGPFANKTITFSNRPQYLDMSNAKTLVEKLGVMYSHSEVSDTNIEAVFDLILETAVRNNLTQDDVPSNVLIVSDMEFNAAQGSYGYYADGSRYNASQNALFKSIERKWTAKGYKLPRLVFWNVASRTGTIPLQQNDNGVALVSGYSPAVAGMVFSAKLDPYEVLVDALNVERYAPVEAAVKSII